MWRGCDLAPEADGGSSGDGISLAVHYQRQVQCLIHWFSSWSKLQKTRVLQELLKLRLPVSVECLDLSMVSVSLTDRPPSIFECQLRLMRQWYEAWPEDVKNFFVAALASVDVDFVTALNEETLRLQLSGL